MKVAIVGSRTSNDTTLNTIIDYIPFNCSEIISGGALGIDSLVKEVARKLDIPLVEFYPDYNSFGKIAPLKRNEEIVKYTDYVIAFWDFKSTGTKFVINKCIETNIPIKVIGI